MGGPGSGRKPEKDPRVNAVLLRLNKKEKAKFDRWCLIKGLSQADCLMFFINYYEKMELTMMDSREYDAYEEAANRDVKTANAYTGTKNSNVCKCGMWMTAVPKQKGITWVCGDPRCGKPILRQNINNNI